MTAPNKEPLLFTHVTYTAMVLAATGMLVATFLGMRDPSPMLRYYSDTLLGWMAIACAAILVRLISRLWGSRQQIQSVAP